MISTASRVDTSTHETDLGRATSPSRLYAWEEDDFVFRRPLDSLRHSLPRDEVRLGERVSVGVFASGSTLSNEVSSSGKDNRGVGFALSGRADERGGRLGLLLGGSLDKNGVSALERCCPASLFDRCIPGRSIDEPSRSC
jgi:hypothetical protein